MTGCGCGSCICLCVCDDGSFFQFFSSSFSLEKLTFSECLRSCVCVQCISVFMFLIVEMCHWKTLSSKHTGKRKKNDFFFFSLFHFQPSANTCVYYFLSCFVSYFYAIPFDRNQCLNQWNSSMHVCCSSSSLSVFSSSTSTQHRCGRKHVLFSISLLLLFSGFIFFHWNWLMFVLLPHFVVNVCSFYCIVWVSNMPGLPDAHKMLEIIWGHFDGMNFHKLWW